MRRHPSTRLSGALAIALLLVVSFASRLHEALVPHAICVQHGEAIELSPVVRPQRTPEASALRPRLVDASAEPRARHEHCVIVLLGRAKEMLDTHGALALPPAGEPQPCAHGGASSAQLAIPLLLLAPKHSPPAQA